MIDIWIAIRKDCKYYCVPDCTPLNAREQPKFTDRADEMVHAVTRELLATGSLADEIFKAAESTLGYKRLADVVGVIGHFTTTAMMANVVGAEPRADASSLLKR